MTPTFLVTGAAGFTGRHLCRLLHDRNYNVVVVNRSAAEDVERCDLSDRTAISGLLERVRPTGIFHFVGSFSDDWKTDLQANVLLTQTLLESVVASALPCRVLLVGSAAEYGTASDGAVSEETPLRPSSVYGVTKAMQTSLMGYYCRRFGLDVVMARTFNLFGDGCSPTLFPGRVLQQARAVLAGSQTKIEVRSLESRRDYLDVAAAAVAYLRIMLHGSSGEIYNVGSGFPMALSDLLLDLIAPLGLTMDDVNVDARATGTRTNIPVIYADITKLLSLPELSPSTD
jgi:GDP-4-dehydro-6-deoxy-D-mannose reductase